MNPKLHAVIALSYYAPYVSGLTETAKVVAEGLASRDWDVTVVAARHQADLASEEYLNGVRVLRTPVIARIGKGAISPMLPIAVARVARAASVLNLHLPMIESALISRLAPRTPIALTYQCDVDLPPSALNRLQVAAMDRACAGASRRAAAVIPSSDDYARHSRIWPAMAGRTHAIAPPCQDRRDGVPTFRDGPGLHVGFLGRIVAEKGLEFLVDGFLATAQPEDRLLIGGDYSNIAGGSVIDFVRARAGGDERIRFLGFLPDGRLNDFYASIDIFALPSVNPLEAFGIVQVEAMMTGVPVIASDMPGVRTPVAQTGFGRIVSPRDSNAIGKAIADIRQNPPDRAAGSAATQARYGAASTIDQYEELLAKVATGHREGG